MTEVFTRYGDGGPRPDHVAPKACTVRHPDAGGQCPREAIGEVWALPFCEVHGREAELAYRDELAQTNGLEFEALWDAEMKRIRPNWSVMEALEEASAKAAAVDHRVLKAAMEAAYPPEELAANIDPDISRYDYERYDGDTPVEWWTEARILAVRFMRQAQSVPILEDLELVRERATVQQLLAERDSDLRWTKPKEVATG